jgi:hypothetical protein
MTKEVQMSIKMEVALRDQFMAVAANHQRPPVVVSRSDRFVFANPHCSSDMWPVSLTEI